MKWQNIFVKILLVIFLLWLGISVTRTLYNGSKLLTEEKSWYFLSDEQKRAKQFGDLHYFLRFTQKNIKTGSNIYLFTDDLTVYYLSRYYLYPTKRFGQFENPQLYKKDLTYDYYVIYPANHTSLVKEAQKRKEFQNYKKIATYHGLSGEVGLIYKK